MGVFVERVNGLVYQHCVGTHAAAAGISDGGCTCEPAEPLRDPEDRFDIRDVNVLTRTAFGGGPLRPAPLPGGGEGCDWGCALGGWAAFVEEAEEAEAAAGEAAAASDDVGRRDSCDLDICVYTLTSNGEEEST